MKKIAILAGGTSSEAEISIQSGQVVINNLDATKYKCFLIEIADQKWNLLDNNQRFPIDKNDFTCYYKGIKLQFDCVFNLIHGTPGEDGKLAGYFDIMQIPYTSSGVLASSLTFNKGFCNQFLTQNEILTPQSIILYIDEDWKNRLSEIILPCFVKPNNGGSSVGTSKVDSEADIIAAIETAFEWVTEIIIEDFIQGREFTQGVIEQNGKLTTLPITEIIVTDGFFDYQQKYAATGGATEITPAELTTELEKEFDLITKRVFKLLKLKNMSRMDYIINDSKLFLIEVNTIPGMAARSILPQQAKHAGIPLSELYAGIIENTLSNY